MTGLLVTLAFAIGTHYYDPSFNYLFLFVCFLLLVVSYALSGTQAKLSGKEIICYGILFVLVCHQWLVTRSPDSSFPMIVTMAALPLTVLVARAPIALMAYWGCFFVVALMATYSASQFLLFGTRSVYPLSDPNNYVTLLCLAWIPCLFFLITQEATRNRVLLVGVGFFVFVVAVLATHSRFAWLALIILFLFLSIGAWRRGVSTTLLLVGALAAGMGGIFYVSGSEPTVTNNVASLLAAPEENRGDDVRLAMIVSAWDIFQEHGRVVVGHGVDTFGLLYPAFRSPIDQVTAGKYVHNDYVQLFFEGGLLLLLPVLVLGAAIAIKLVRAVFKQDKWDASVGFALACAVALLHANLNFVLYIFVLLMFLGVNLSLAFPQVKSPQVKSWTAPSYLRPVVVVGLLLSSAYLLLDVYNTGVFSAQKGVPGATAIRSDTAMMDRFTQWSVRLNPDRGLPKLGQAEIDRVLGRTDGENLIHRYEAAIEADPWNPLTYSRYSTLFAEGQDPQRYERLLTEAWRLDPQDPVVARELIHHLWLSGRREEAERKAIAITQWCPLIRRRSAAQLDELSGYLSELYKRMQSDELAARIEACEVAQETTGGGVSHQATWLQRLLVELD